MSERIATYREFWPFYLREHSRRACRALHYLGTTIAIACLVLLVATGSLWFLLGGVVSGYAFAWACTDALLILSKPGRGRVHFLP